MSEIIGIKIGDEIIDTQTAKERGLDGEKILFDNSVDSLSIIRHSCAHLMAQAIKELYPDAKFFVGPVVDEGFYYDFKTAAKIGEEDLANIEKRMKEIAKRKLPIIKSSLSRNEAMKKFKDDELKLAVMKRIEGDVFGVYQQGDFEDLCRGPHLPNTRFLHSFKLTKLAGAYLGGDEKAEMLHRIYGIAFADKESLNAYINQIEEAKKRDHRKLGTELKLFSFDDDIGGGLPIWLSNGARLRSKLEHMLYKIHRLRGYEPVRGPELLKAKAWQISGHYENYKENMYFTQIDEQEYGIKPMNCVGHIKIYQNDIRSYRDLPLKFFEYGVVHRHEKSGVLHGLFRVREFTQDDAHIFCMPSQIKEQVIEILAFVDKLMKLFDFSYEMEISTKPSKAIGDDEIWQNATNALKQALDEQGLKYGIDEGGGAFYGPKIDVKLLDCIGREWQCSTIQVDFTLPERFNLTYVGQDGERHRPVMVHRAIMGSVERFIGVLIEQYAGALPVWLAPEQARLLTVTDAAIDAARDMEKTFAANGIRVSLDDRNEKLGFKVREAQVNKIPYMLVVGEKEAQSGTVSVRLRTGENLGMKTVEETIELIRAAAAEPFTKGGMSYSFA